MSPMVNHNHIPQPHPLFPLPLNEAEAEAATSPLVDKTGRCAWFCDQVDVPTSGATVADHGPKCESSRYFDGFNASDVYFDDAEKTAITGTLTAPYLHGTYNADDVSNRMFRRQGWITLDVIVPDDEDVQLNMQADQARKIALGLLSLADKAERPARTTRECRDIAAAHNRAAKSSS